MSIVRLRLALLILLVLGWCGGVVLGDAAPLWQADLANGGLDSWVVSHNGGVDANVVIDPSQTVRGSPSLKFDSRSPRVQCLSGHVVPKNISGQDGR